MRNVRLSLRSGAIFGLALVAALLLVPGCGTKVREVQVENRPVADRDGTASDLKGMPREAVEYFRAKYPNDSWDLAPAPPVVAVGPTVFSRAALGVLAADPNAKDPAAAVGDGVTLAADNGKATFVTSQRYSPGAQAAITEVLAESGAFSVKGIDEAAGLDLYRGKLQYTHLYEQKVKLFVESNVTADAGGGLQVYVRLIDTKTGTVLSAVSQTGREVGTTARAAATLLLSRVASAR